MTYHTDQKSSFPSFGACNLAQLPFKLTKSTENIPTPSNLFQHLNQTAVFLPATSENNNPDFIDDVIKYFRLNVLFAYYDIENNEDRTFVYCTLYLTNCLKLIYNSKTRAEAAEKLFHMAINEIQEQVPGDIGFPLNGIFSRPEEAKDRAALVNYLINVRLELSRRILEITVDQKTGERDKWWFMFRNYRFINKELGGTGVY